ncbi:CHAT domain-containing protein [Apiospora marii]|uniref:CHAT domain-containing protein n=1 Tax=Apiospora marii TaxID=335849 RepID=UPI003131BE28
MADLQNSYQSHISAFHQNTSPIYERISSAQHLLSSPFVLHDQEHALQLASEAIELLPQLTPRALQNADKQHLLVQAAGLASDAAALAVLAGEPASAVTWLEAGRGVLASALQEIRTDLSSLHQNHPTLATTFEDSRHILDAPTRSELNLAYDTADNSLRNDVDLRRQAQTRLEEVIQQIREQPGYEWFLLPPAAEELVVTATHGPIVLINVSRHRCDALIVQSTGIQHCELPSLTYQDIQEHRKSVSLASPSMLEWLWDAIVERVLDTLHLMQGMSAGPWQRLWWIPTGPLVGFPLHAAGYHTARDGRTTLDRVASLYATSVRSLIPLRQQKSSEAARGLVLVNMQDTPGQSYLHHAAREIHQVEETSRSLCLTVTQPEKKKKAVRKALRECQIFHFAGHGGTDARHPLQSKLLLTDWKEDPLTVESLLEMDLQHHAPFLAYLSACGSGEVRDAGSVDESIHLSSACQLAGFRHVIGTLWSVDDALCVTMARLTYEFLAEQGLSDESVSYGVHSASRYLRDEWVREVRKSEGSQDEGGNQGDRGNQDEEGGGSDSRRGANLVGTAEASAAYWVPYVHYGA